MSLDKAVKYGKEKREPYRRSQAIDMTCRNHGSCPYCEQNRLHKFRDRHPDDTVLTGKRILDVKELEE